MKFKPKLFQLEISVKIAERSAWMDKVPEMEFSLKEHVPTGVHPIDYLRQRLSEEIKRHASQTTIKTKEPITTSSELSE